MNFVWLCPAERLALLSLLTLLPPGLSSRFSALVDRCSAAMVDSILLGTLPAGP